MANYDQISVFSPHFCFPHPINLDITKEVRKIGSFFVNDVNGNRIFKVENFPPHSSFTKVLRDAAGVPIATLREKPMFMRIEWKVFRGESTNEEDLLFKARISLGLFQIRTYHVFMANNTSEDVPHYTIRGIGWTERSCQVCVGDSSTVIAQMTIKTSGFSRKDRITVTLLHPNVDCAFIVALMAIYNSFGSSS